MKFLKTLSFLLLTLAVLQTAESCSKSIMISDSSTSVMSEDYSGPAVVYSNPEWTANITDAKWIWKDSNNGDESVSYFYRTFYLEEKPFFAMIELAADDAADVFINTVFTQCSCVKNCHIQENKKGCEITDYISSGKNKLIIRVKNYGGPGALKYKIHIIQ